MQWRISDVILSIDLTPPRLEIVACSIGASETCPMKWCTLLIVCRINTNAFLAEEGKTVGLVSLSSYMQHINSLFVLHPNVCSIPYEQFDEFDISMEACEV